jgi:hypothetical protein
MRQTLVAVGCVSLLVVGCAGDDESVATTTAAASPTAASPAPSAQGSVGAALVPEAVCVGDNDEVFFAYDNASSDVVVVAEGDANSLTAGAADDNPLMTTLFAPGRVDPAFWAFPAGEDPLVWTLVGPDGVERMAAADDSLGACPPGYPDDAVDDPRRPELEIFAYEISPDRTQVEVFLELSGVPETSVCNPAFEPGPVLVSIGDGTEAPTRYAPRTSVVLGPFTKSPQSGDMVAPGYLHPLVVDQCSAAGVTMRTWSAAEALRRLTFVSSTPAVCARLDDAGDLTVSLYESCDGPPTTGGSIRPT